MQNDVMTDKFIDYVNDRIEDLDMTKSSLARSVGLDKNSVTKYLKKEKSRNVFFESEKIINEHIKMETPINL